MYCPECGLELEDDVQFCTQCGAEQPSPRAGSAKGDRRANGRVTISVDSASALNITCRHCGERPIEEVATGHRVTGMILAYRWESQQLIGCHQCVRDELWKMAGKNLLTGWWSIRTAALTPFLTLWNFGRGAYNRGPSQTLADLLEEAGILFDFLHDKSQFTPKDHHRLELYIRAMIRLGVAVMLADGQAEDAEKEAISESVHALFPDYPDENIADLIERAASRTTDVASVAEQLEQMLPPEGKRLVLKFTSSVLQSGTVSDEGVEVASIIARGLGLDEADVDEVLSSDSQPSADVEAIKAAAS